MNRHDQLIWREIVRRNELGLRKYQGVPGWLLQRKSTGTPCPNCLDEIVGGEAVSDCPVCFGTGIAGGYHTPVSMPGDWQSTAPADNTRLADPGVSDLNKTTLLTLHTPTCEFKDLWVDAATNLRYEVQKVDTQEFRGQPTAQILTLSKLAASDPAYRIPVPLE